MIRRLMVASAAALVAGVAAVLGLAAVIDATWDPSSSVLLALAAVLIPQALYHLARRPKENTKP